MENSVTGEKLQIERYIDYFGQIIIRRLPTDASEWNRTAEQMLELMQEENKVPVISVNWIKVLYFIEVIYFTFFFFDRIMTNEKLW